MPTLILTLEKRAQKNRGSSLSYAIVIDDSVAKPKGQPAAMDGSKEDNESFELAASLTVTSDT